MIRPGPRNLITDVQGILVGNAEDQEVRTGVTVVVAEEAAIAAVDVRGGAPGTCNTTAVHPGGIVERADAVVLSGGSAFGLAAVGGAMAALAARERGFAVASVRVPIVLGAILFDLLNGGDKAWGAEPPYRTLARRAAERAGGDFAQGNAGAGLGAKAGALKGGLGSASFAYVEDGEPITVGAVVAANPAGSVLIPGTETFWAWALEQAGELGGQRPPEEPLQGAALDQSFPEIGGANTAIAVVATDAELDRNQAQRLATMAHDGLARAIRPAHTPLDGDTIFVLATGRRGRIGPAAGLARLGMLAADCVARAVARGVYEARDLGELQSYRSLRADRSGRPETTRTATR